MDTAERIAMIGRLFGCISQVTPTALGGPVTVFHSLTVPSIPTALYLDRLLYMVHPDDKLRVSLVAMIYFCRLNSKTNYALLSSLTLHRMMAACVWASVKYLFDSPYGLSEHTRLAGLRGHEGQSQEKVLVDVLEWRLFVSEEEFALASRIISM